MTALLGSAIPVDGQQVAALFRALKLDSAQAEADGVVWYFEGGVVLRQQDAGGFRVSIAPVRCGVVA